MNTIVIALSKRQAKRLSNGKAIQLSRKGQSYLLTRKVTDTREAKILAKIAKLRSSLRSVILSKKHHCPQAQCDKLFDTKKGANMHHKRMHIKNWSTKGGKS